MPVSIIVCCPQDELQHQDTDTASSTVFKTPLSDFDALVALREEALPFPDRAILGSITSTSTDDDEDDGMLSSRKARARLHSIPQGQPTFTVTIQ